MLRQNKRVTKLQQIYGEAVNEQLEQEVKLFFPCQLRSPD